MTLTGHDFEIRNWRQFQHYHDRNPPWIKLHYELLSSRDWVSLDDASRVLAVACMLIASRNDGKVPYDPEYVRRVAYLNTVPDFAPLVRCGFLIGDETTAPILPPASPSDDRDRDRDRDRGASAPLADASGTLAPASTHRKMVCAIQWTAEAGFSGITESDRERWAAAYPACNIDVQLGQMNEWLLANTAKARKSNWRKFITGWLTRSQDRGGDLRSSRPTAPSLPLSDAEFKEAVRREDEERRKRYDAEDRIAAERAAKEAGR
jgi:hypothetical protein